MAKVLVVDDYPDVLRLLEVALRKEHQVLTAEDGESALAIVAREAPDMVVLDVMMPGIDGYRVLYRLRDDPATRHLPVILLTARDQDHDIAFGLSLGADYYLPKPFSPTDLASLVRHHFAAEPPAARALSA